MRMGPPLVSRALWDAFWAAYRSTGSVEDAVMASGVSGSSARRWVRQRGGIAPPGRESSGRYLSLDERIEIQAGMQSGWSVRRIARELGRSASTVSREIARNASRRSRYRAATADSHARQRAMRPKPRKLACDDRLAREVSAGLQRRWSPREISERLSMDFPDDPGMRISHEAIYQSLFMLGRGGLRKELTKALRSGRAIRRPRRVVGQRRGRIPGMVMISERDAEAADRAVPGHWESQCRCQAAIGRARTGSAYGVWSRSMTQMTFMRRRARAMRACLCDLPSARLRS